MRQQVIDVLLVAGLDTPDVESQVAAGLDAAVREWIVLAYVARIARELRRRQPDDSRQGWLALPEYEHIPADAAGDSLDQLRARITRLEKRIRNYDYARRAQEKLKEDKRQLRDLKQLETQIAPYFAGEKATTVTQAVLMYRESLEKPARRQRKDAIRSRWRRNEKSTTSES